MGRMSTLMVHLMVPKGNVVVLSSFGPFNLSCSLVFQIKNSENLLYRKNTSFDGSPHAAQR